MTIEKCPVLVLSVTANTLSGLAQDLSELSKILASLEQLGYDKFTTKAIDNVVHFFLTRPAELGQPSELTTDVAISSTQQNWDEMRLEELSLSNRTFNSLTGRHGNLRTVGELLKKSETELLHIKLFGKKQLDEITSALKRLNLSLRQPLLPPQK